VSIALVCVVALVGCCGLAWWQWTRFESASGTFQNLGYVLQWPLFGLFPAFMVWRIRKLDAQRAVPVPKTEPPVVAPTPVVTVDAVRAPVVDEDDELAVYNRYLAELNSRDQR
jgi:DNA-binding transcriptional regulator of glucitol operon